jgi:hypothetical protein
MMMLQTIIVKNGLIRINDSTPEIQGRLFELPTARVRHLMH